MTPPDHRVRVAIAQDEITPDLASGLARTDHRAAEAARAGAALVVFPETWLPGYPAWLDVCRDAGLWDHPPVKAVYRRMADESVVVDGASGHELRAIARRNRIAVVIGVIERVEHGPAHGTLFNTLLTFGPDSTLLNDAGRDGALRASGPFRVRGPDWNAENQRRWRDAQVTSAKSPFGESLASQCRQSPSRFAAE